MSDRDLIAGFDGGYRSGYKQGCKDCIEKIMELLNENENEDEIVGIYTHGNTIEFLYKKEEEA